MNVSSIGTQSSSEAWVPSSSVPSGALVRFPMLLVYGVLLFIASLFRTGYAVYVGNHALQIPLVYVLNDPSLYPHDPFVRTLGTYASWFWPAVAFGARFIPLSGLLLVLFLCERALLLYGVVRLARAFAPDSTLGIVGAMTVFAAGMHPFIGGGTIVSNYTEQTGFAIPLLLLGIAAFYGRRPMACAVWLGIGCNVNILYGMYTLSYLGAVWLVDMDYRRAWREWVAPSCIFVLLSSPILVLTADAFGRESSDATLWYLAARARHPHHLFPLTWSRRAFGMLGAIATLVLFFFRYQRPELPRLSRHVSMWTITAAAWLAYAFLAAYVVKTPSLLVISAARAVDIWMCFAAVVLSVVVGRGAETGVPRDRVFWACAMAGSVLIWFPDLSVFIVALGLLAMAWPLVRDRMLRADARSMAAGLVGWLAVVALNDTATRWAVSATIEDTFVERADLPVREVAEWARRNTARDAVFLVDPTWDSFRGLSLRPVFVTYEDGAALLWQRSFVQEWVDRLRAIGLDVRDGASIKDPRKVYPWLSGTYERLQDSDARRLSELGLVRYWVVSRSHVSTFPVVYQTGANKVLQVQ